MNDRLSISVSLISYMITNVTVVSGAKPHKNPHMIPISHTCWEAMVLSNIFTCGLRMGFVQKLFCGYQLQVLLYFQAHLVGHCVDIDKDKQQEIEKDANDSQHGQESLLWCAEMWTR